MEYSILNTSQNETIFTEIEFVFDDGTKEIIEIAHFNPQSIEEIEQNIQNRYESECLKKQLEKQ